MASRSVIKNLYPVQSSAASELIGKRIKQLMEAKQWNAAKLASVLGVHTSSTREYISGNSNYTLSTIIALEQVLGGKIIEVVKQEEPELI